jgi:hypothetical protein
MPIKLKLLWPFVLTMLIPLVAAYFVYPNHLPPSFMVFPPEQIPGTPGFNLIYFIILSLAALLVTALLLLPGLFGFKRNSSTAPAPAHRKLPWWFYVGLVFMLTFWWLHWSRSFIFGDLVYYAFSPMWWGFIVMLDGLVYFFTGGKSLIINRTSLFIISATFSVFGWWYFEYFDYFVLSNWYYPNGHMSELSHSTIVIIFLVAYTTVWPAIFEWYTLLNAFPKLVARWSDGIKLQLNGTVLIVLGALVIAGCAALPYPLFWGVWVGPLAMLTGQLIRLGIWTPFTPLAQGNWSPAILVALASLFNGFLWEFWNHGSEAYNPFNMSGPIAQTNPNYWIYDIPYVNVIHIYSEMPLLGYLGYLPFGLFVWIMYIWAGKLFGWRSDLDLS